MTMLPIPSDPPDERPDTVDAATWIDLMAARLDAQIARSEATEARRQAIEAERLAKVRIDHYEDLLSEVRGQLRLERHGR